MADVNTSNLCTQIIHSHFGPLTSKVAFALLTRGRLTLLQLVRYTSMKARAVRASVLVLIQHNLAWHAQSEDGVEVIEFNPEECILRLRFGRYVWQTEELLGAKAAEIVSLVLDHGKLRPTDILSQLCKAKTKEHQAYSQALHKLVHASYLVPSTVLSHVSPRDKLMEYEKDERAQLKNFPTAKELREAKEKAEARLKREQDEAMKIGLTKRKAPEHNGQRSAKRKATDDLVVDDDVFFRVNPTKFNIHIRNKLIVNAVRERYNNAAAIVVRAALKASEAKQLSLSDIRSDPISTANIIDHIAEEEDITSGLAYATSKKPSTMSAIKEYLGVLSAADNPTPAGKMSSFVTFSGSGKVSVEFEIVCRRLRRRVIEAIARERHGDEAVRLMRFLLDNGKMGGDQLAKAAMMTDMAVRPLLTNLSAESLVSIQEVPKGADRNPQRTIYLWYVDLHKAYAVALGNLYKTLYNINMRRRAEEEDAMVKAVLQKCQRSDVQEDPTLLSRVERETLRSWEERRDKLLVLEMRVEEAVFILRDLAVLGIEDD